MVHMNSSRRPNSWEDCDARQYSIPEDQEEATQSKRRHWVELWKHLRMDCAGGMLISPKKLGKCLEEIEKRERFTGSDHCKCFETLPPEYVEKLARSLSMMC